MIFAEEYGFLPENDGYKNACALQRAVDTGGEIIVEKKGVYLLADTVTIGDNTTLCFCDGVYVKRVKNNVITGNVFINKGAYTREYNKNIKIIGLRLICDGVVSDSAKEGCDKVIVGLNGHIAFHYVENAVISDFECLDLPAKDFAVQICTFKNILVENVRIEGLKDGVHLGLGSGFIIRNGKFKTFDDPIALNAHDYSTSNPQLGWIENGIVENCVDLDDDTTTGFFCRILAGSWRDWEKGMIIQRSDTVVCGSRLYRSANEPDGIERRSMYMPYHEKGLKIYEDGIMWVPVQEGKEYNCGCRNIRFSNITIEKKRPVAFSLHFDKDRYSRSYYPDSEIPVQKNIVMNNVHVTNDVPIFLHTITPLENLSLNGCDLNGGSLDFRNINTPGAVYNTADVTLCSTKNVGMINCDEGRNVSIKKI